MNRRILIACTRVLPVIASMAIAGCGKDAPVPTECWKGRKLQEKQPRSALMFCISGADAHKTTSSPGQGGKAAACKAPGRVVSRSEGSLNITFDSGSCENGRNTAAHKMSCRSAEGRAWACQFSSEAKLPGWWIFSPVAQSD